MQAPPHADVGPIAFVLYEQKSWRLDDGALVHLEGGFLRPAVDGAAELMLAHAIGVTEVAHGRVVGTTIELVTRPMAMHLEAELRRTP
jgi:hypothetical protein